MKIKLCLFSLSLVFVISAQAQNARLQAGVNLANVSVTDDGHVDESKTLTSFQVGLIGDLPLAGIFSFQPGLVFTGKGTKSRSGDQNTLTQSKATTNPYYIELPLNFVLKTPISSGKNSSQSRFFVGAGPYIAAGITGKIKNEGRTGNISYMNERNIEFSNDDPTTLDYEEGAGFGIMRRFDYGLNGLVGIEGKSVVLSANYGLGLAKLQSGSNNSEDNNNKHRVLSFTLGFKL